MNEPIGIAMVLQHFTNKYLNTVPALAEPRVAVTREVGGEARESALPDTLGQTSKDKIDSRGGVQTHLSGGVESRHAEVGKNSPEALVERPTIQPRDSGSSALLAQTLSNVQHQEVVIEVHRFGEGGEPLTLRVLCCAKYSNERDWEALPDGEVVETKGDYKAGEVIHLTLDELDEVKREGEREYSRDE